MAWRLQEIKAMANRALIPLYYCAVELFPANPKPCAGYGCGVHAADEADAQKQAQKDYPNCTVGKVVVHNHKIVDWRSPYQE